MTEAQIATEMSCVSKKSQTMDIVQSNLPIKNHPLSQTVRECRCKDSRVEKLRYLSVCPAASRRGYPDTKNGQCRTLSYVPLP